MTLTVAALSADNFAAWTTLFAESCNSCFCQYWHFAGTKNEWLARCAFDEETNRQQSEQLLAKSEFSGIVAFDDSGACIGWLKLSPAAQLVKLRNQSVYRKLNLDQQDVLIVGCILVHPAHRNRGVARELLVGAIAEARKQGARSIEAYPHDVGHRVHDEQAMMGRVSLFASCGFEKSIDNDVYPVFRILL